MKTKAQLMNLTKAQLVNLIEEMRKSEKALRAINGDLNQEVADLREECESVDAENASLHEVRSRQDRLLTGYMKQVEEYDSLIIEQANTITQRMNDEHAEYRASIEREFAKERANLLGQIEGQQNLFESMVMEVINS